MVSFFERENSVHTSLKIFPLQKKKQDRGLEKQFNFIWDPKFIGILKIPSTSGESLGESFAV